MYFCKVIIGKQTKIFFRLIFFLIFKNVLKFIIKAQILLDKTVMQSDKFDPIKNSNFLENKENFDIQNVTVRQVPSMLIPFLYETPPLEILKETITKLSEQLILENKPKKGRKRKRSSESDDSWKMDSSAEESDDLDDLEDLDDLDDLDDFPQSKKLDSFSLDEGSSKDFFENPIGTLLMSIGSNLVKEHCSKKNKTPKDVLEMKRCEFCKFKTESSLVLANHYETPHKMYRGFKCNFCKTICSTEFKTKFHMETIHYVKARLQKSGAIFECEYCEYDSPLKFMVEEHTVECGKRFNLNRNLTPPVDWEPPAKIRKEFSSVIKHEVVTQVEPVQQTPAQIPKQFSSVISKVVKAKPAENPKDCSMLMKTEVIMARPAKILKVFSSVIWKEVGKAKPTEIPKVRSMIIKKEVVKVRRVKGFQWSVVINKYFHFFFRFLKNH